MTTREVVLDGGLPWGFRMHGGADVNQPLRISRVNPGSKAALRGIREGDIISSINGQLTKDLTNTEAHGLLKNAGDALKLGLNEDSSGSPKRRQYKTVHQETHLETVKRSSITTLTVKSTKTFESQSELYNEDYPESKTNEKINGDSKSASLDQAIASQGSTLSSNCTSPSTPSSLYTEPGTASSTSLLNNNQQYSASGVLSDDVMADSLISNSRSRRRRARNQRKKIKKPTSSQLDTIPDSECSSKCCDNSEVEVETITHKEIKEFEELKTDYRVDSPEITTDKIKTKRINKNIKTVVKSKSLDDDDLVQIQELSETSESEEKNECQAIISEAESDVEWEVTSDIPPPEKDKGKLSTLTLPVEEHFTQQATLISPEEELTLRIFLESLNLVSCPEDAAKQAHEKSTAESIKISKAKKRAALEEYFLPIVHNPRYLDVISEETSDLSDREQPTMLSHHLKQGTPELDIVGPTSKPPLATRKERKSNISKIPRKIQTRFQAPVSQPSAVLVGTKLIDAPILAEGVCSTSRAETVSGVEIVYLNESSDSDSSDYEECNEDMNESFKESEDTLKCQDVNGNHIVEESLKDVESNFDSAVLTQLTPPPTPGNTSPKNGNSLVHEIVESREVTQYIRDENLQSIEPDHLIESQLNQEIETHNKENTEILEIPDSLSYSNAVSSPAPSRTPSPSSDGSSRGTSLSTAKYNPLNSSIGDINSISKDEELIKDKSYYLPLTLREICLKCLISLPFGAEVLQELADVSMSIETLTSKLPSIFLPKIAPNLPAFVNKEKIIDCNVQSSAFTVNPVDMPTERNWVGMPTDQDPNVLVCLSPKQKTELEKTSKLTDEAGKLLDLHEKFLSRRSYNESFENLDVEEKVIVTKLSETSNSISLTSPTSNNHFLTIIREDPVPLENKDDYNDYLYFEAKDNTRNRSTLPRVKATNNISDSTSISDSARLNAKDLTEWLHLARQRSMSESNLTTAAEFKHETAQVRTNNRVQPGNNLRSMRRRTSLPQELYERQLLHLIEREREIQKELEKLEEEKRRLAAEMAPSKDFEPEDYYISRRGDYAERNVKPRPHSMPVAPTEYFRQQMYDEYMNQVAAREDRKQHKVIKVTSSKQNVNKTENDKETFTDIQHVCGIEDEFMNRVKQKNKMHREETRTDESDMEKTSFDLSEDDEDAEPVLVMDGDKLKDAKQLPKHLQEFVDMTKSAAENISDDGVGKVHCRRKCCREARRIHRALSRNRAQDNSSLLHEIDAALTTAKGFLLCRGIWTPGQRQDTTPTEVPKIKQTNSKDEPIQPVWTPKSATSSPTVERKEFRPVNFESPVLSRKNRPKTENSGTPESSSTEPPWKIPESSSDGGVALSSSLEKRLPTSHSSPASGFGEFSSPRLPKAQNPTITLLQKAREGQLPRGASYIEQEQNNFRRSYNERPTGISPGEIVYQIKNEYTSESDGERPRKMADLGPRKYEGIGPVTKDGMPMILRSEIKDNNQSKWYKRMYDTIHKQRPHNTNYPYASGYLSEPEPGSYDSDFGDRYATLDRRRPPPRESDYSVSSTMPRHMSDKSSSSSNILRNKFDIYKNQPGRIENYTPGHSSISEKEAKEWWDEVMDIFDGHLEQQKRVPQTRSFINQALKESGYESDSTLVFRRKEEAAQQLSPQEQKEAYKVIQKGGDVPLHGLRKPAPERPKDDGEIEYFPLSPTLTRIRIHTNIKPQKEVTCYPVRVEHTTPNIFANYKRSAPSCARIPDPPPSPPRRRSSRNNSTLRLISTMKVKSEKLPVCKRHETCFTASTNVDKTKVKYLRDKITCQLSPSIKRKCDSPKIRISKTITTSPEFKSKITSAVTTTKDPKSSLNKVHSKTNIISAKSQERCCGLRSRSVDSNRKMCKACRLNIAERTCTAKSEQTLFKSESEGNLKSKAIKTFGTEKRKFDLILPKTDIRRSKLIKSPDLVSPTEVKKAVSSPTYKQSTVVFSSAKNRNIPAKFTTLPIKVGFNDKAKNILKNSFQRPPSIFPTSSPRLTRNKNTKSTSSVSTTSEKSKLSSLESLQSPKLERRAISCKDTYHKNPSDAQKIKKSKKEQINGEIAKKGKLAKEKKERDKTVKCAGRSAGTEIVKQMRKIEDEFIDPSTSSALDDIKRQKEAIQSDFFFQHLLLRNVSPPPSIPSRNSWIVERTQQLQRRVSSVTEPTIGAMKVYLRHTKPVTDSKFRSLDIAYMRSRSASPKSVTWENDTIMKSTSRRSTSLPAKIVRSQTSRPVSPSVSRRHIKSSVSPTRFSDSSSPIAMSSKGSIASPTSPRKLIFSETSRPISPIVRRRIVESPTATLKPVTAKLFFSQTSRPVSPEIKRKIEKVSAPPPPPIPTKLIFTETSRPLSPIIKRKEISSPNHPSKLIFSETSRPISPVIQRKYTRSPSPPLSPKSIRSPSSRRIMNIRSSIRERSPDVTLYMCPSITQSTSSLNSCDLSEYPCYVKGFSHSPEKSKKFKDLNLFYSDIERVGQLEHTTSSISLKPRKKCENEIIDYDRWREVRVRERAEEELKSLYSQLKFSERDKGFLFSPKDINRYRWKREFDRGLRIKEKSVENIKEEFERLQQEETEIENARRRELQYLKDNYKPLWRGNSVIRLANILTERRSQSEGRMPPSRQKLIESERLLTHGIGSRIWSSLSMEQVNVLKEQLAEIYSQNLTKPKTPDYSIRVPKDNMYSAKLSVRRNSDSSERTYTSRPALPSSGGMSETEKKMLSQTISKEAIDCLTRKKVTKHPQVVLGKETRGAVAAAVANVKPTSKEHLAEKPLKAVKAIESEKQLTLPKKPLVKTDAVSPTKLSCTSETESGSTDESTKTVLFVGNENDIKKKVEYFETSSELQTYTPTFYKPAETHDDVGDTITVEKSQEPEKERTFNKLSTSRSCQSLKDFFGEKNLAKFATIPLSATRKQAYVPPPAPQFRALSISPIRSPSISGATSYDSLCRSRSLSPFFDEPQALVKAGEVRRLKSKFEYLEDFYTHSLTLTPRRCHSDSELNKRCQIFIPGQSIGDVDFLRRKYEYPAYSGRGRSRTRRGGVVSPMFLRAEDRYMPHINIISKIASLYSKKCLQGNGKPRTTEELAEILGCPVGEVDKLRDKFNSIGRNISLLGRMFTSSPDVKELRDIAPYLAASWTAHKYPRSEDNTRSLSSPDTSLATRDTSLVRKERTRPKSTSPPRSTKKSSILKSRYLYVEPFENQKSEEKILQAACRYHSKNDQERYKSHWTSTHTRPSVSFKDPEPPIPPPKGLHGQRNLGPGIRQQM